MRLIATLGATNPSNKQIYELHGQTYKTFFSFLALKKHFGIKDKDVIIIGTSLTKKVLGDSLKKFRFEKVSADNLESIFEISVDYIDRDTIIDITQSFRSIPLAVFMASAFSKSLRKEPKEIYYAEILSENCVPKDDECQFRFVSLIRYLEIADLAREINTFSASFYVLNQSIKTKEFKFLQNSLQELSKKLLINDIRVEEEITNLRLAISKLKRGKLYYLDDHLENLEKELKNIKDCLKSSKEYERLFNMSNLYFSKNLLLQSITTFYEAILAYLHYKIGNNLNECLKNRRGYKANSFEIRNCMKNMFIRNGCKSKPFNSIEECRNVNSILRKLDKMRNQSAHAFAYEKNLVDFKEELRNLLKKFKV